MHEFVLSKPAHSEADIKPEMTPSTIDRFVIKVSRLSGYVFMAAAIGLIVSFFL